MNNLKKLLKIELEKYTNILSKLKYISPANDDKLHITVKNGNPKYYRVTKENNSKIYHYIKKKDIEIARSLAKNSYKLKLEKILIKRIRQLSQLVSTYNENEIDLVYENLHKFRKTLINPVVPTLSRLQEIKSSRKDPTPYFPQGLTYKTKRGDFVRSKSEKILSDYFFDNKIIYFYEYPIKLSGITIRPDFTFIHPITKMEIYWEHFGKLTDSDYLSKSLSKISLYRKNGIFLDERLVITYEDSNNPLDISEIELLVKRCLL